MNQMVYSMCNIYFRASLSSTHSLQFTSFSYLVGEVTMDQTWVRRSLLLPYFEDYSRIQQMAVLLKYKTQSCG